MPDVLESNVPVPQRVACVQVSQHLLAIWNTLTVAALPLELLLYTIFQETVSNNAKLMVFADAGILGWQAECVYRHTVEVVKLHATAQ